MKRHGERGCERECERLCVRERERERVNPLSRLKGAVDAVLVEKE